MLKNTDTKKITTSALFCAVICVISPFVIQIGVIPLSFSNFAVMLCAFVLPFSNSLLAVIGYLLLGLCSLPVFASFQGGAQVLFGVTGGFLWGYVILCVCCSLARNKKTFIQKTVLCLCGLFGCYAIGILQYCIVLKASFLSGLLVCVVPFIVFDIIKCILAFLLGQKIKMALKL